MLADRVASMWLWIRREVLFVVYASVPSSSSESPSFFESLGWVLKGNPTGDSIVLLEDLNTRVCNDSMIWRRNVFERNLLPNVNASCDHNGVH